ncbi:hypothetical protein HK101_009985 [Irineochytrium annulatum]|nr:hypothetical protein HK101_009985 [Irineochytrium annulatum]
MDRGEGDLLSASSMKASQALSDAVDSSDNVISMLMSMMEKNPTITSPMLDLDVDGADLFKDVGSAIPMDGLLGESADMKGIGVENDIWMFGPSSDGALLPVDFKATSGTRGRQVEAVGRQPPQQITSNVHEHHYHHHHRPPAEASADGRSTAAPVAPAAVRRPALNENNKRPPPSSNNSSNSNSGGESDGVEDAIKNARAGREDGGGGMGLEEVDGHQEAAADREYRNVLQQQVARYGLNPDGSISGHYASHGSPTSPKNFDAAYYDRMPVNPASARYNSKYTESGVAFPTGHAYRNGRGGVEGRDASTHPYREPFFYRQSTETFAPQRAESGQPRHMSQDPNIVSAPSLPHPVSDDVQHYQHDQHLHMNNPAYLHHPGYYQYYNSQHYSSYQGGPSNLVANSNIPHHHGLQQHSTDDGSMPVQERIQLREHQQYFTEHGHRTTSVQRLPQDAAEYRRQHGQHHHHHHHHHHREGDERAAGAAADDGDDEGGGHPSVRAKQLEARRMREPFAAGSAVGVGVRHPDVASLASVGGGGAAMTATSVMNSKEVQGLNKALGAFQTQRTAEAAAAMGGAVPGSATSNPLAPRLSSGQLDLGGGPESGKAGAAMVTLEDLARKVQDSAAEVMATVQALQRERRGSALVGTPTMPIVGGGLPIGPIGHGSVPPAGRAKSAPSVRETPTAMSAATGKFGSPLIRSPSLQMSSKPSSGNDMAVAVAAKGGTVPVATTSKQSAVAGILGGDDGGETSIHTKGVAVTNFFTGTPALFSKLIPHLDDLLLALGRDTKILYASPSAIHFLKSSPETLIGRNLKDLVHDDDVPIIVNAVENGFAEGTGFTIYIRIKDSAHRTPSSSSSSSSASLLDVPTPDGIPMKRETSIPPHLRRHEVLELLGRPVVDVPTGNVIYMLEVGRSYTQQTQQDQAWASRLENARLRALLEEELKVRGVDPRGHPLLDGNAGAPAVAVVGKGKAPVAIQAAVSPFVHGRMPPPPTPLQTSLHVAGPGIGAPVSAVVDTPPGSATMAGSVGWPPGPPILVPIGAGVASASSGSGSVPPPVPAVVKEGSSAKPPRKKKVKIPKEELFCRRCGTTVSPEWRKGPEGPKTLCNACGLAHSKKQRKDMKVTQVSASAVAAAAVAAAAGSTASIATETVPTVTTATTIAPPINSSDVPTVNVAPVINIAPVVTVAPVVIAPSVPSATQQLAPRPAPTTSTAPVAPVPSTPMEGVERSPQAAPTPAATPGVAGVHDHPSPPERHVKQGNASLPHMGPYAPGPDVERSGVSPTRGVGGGGWGYGPPPVHPMDAPHHPMHGPPGHARESWGHGAPGPPYPSGPPPYPRGYPGPGYQHPEQPHQERRRDSWER